MSKVACVRASGRAPMDRIGIRRKSWPIRCRCSVAVAVRAVAAVAGWATKVVGIVAKALNVAVAVRVAAEVLRAAVAVEAARARRPAVGWMRWMTIFRSKRNASIGC